MKRSFPGSWNQDAATVTSSSTSISASVSSSSSSGDLTLGCGNSGSIAGCFAPCMVGSECATGRLSNSQQLHRSHDRYPRQSNCRHQPRWFRGVDQDEKIVSSAEQRLVEDFKSLSVKERTEIYEEIHGVGSVIEETADFVNSKLDQLDTCIENISAKEPYKQAHFLSQTYVEDRKFRLQFLRAESFQPQKAAERLVLHFKKKLALFGLGCLGRKLCWNDLKPDVQEALIAGCFQMFPDCTDSVGRCLVVNLYKYRLQTVRTDDCLASAIWYISMQCIERLSDESHRRGAVPVTYPIDISVADANRELIREARTLLFDVIPMRVTAAHFCFDNIMMKRLFSLLVLAAPKEVSSRCRLHLGSHVECQYILNSFGISSKSFPLDSEGTLKAGLFQQRMGELWALEGRRMIEEDELREIVSAELAKADSPDSAPGLPVPRSNDILLGRSAVQQFFPGNLNFIRTLEENLSQYQSIVVSDRSAKTAFSERLLCQFKAEGSRFIQRHKDGLWREVSSKKARGKIAMGFRNLARKSTQTSADLKDENGSTTSRGAKKQ